MRATMPFAGGMLVSDTRSPVASLTMKSSDMRGFDPDTTT